MNKEKINYFIYARKSTEPEGRQILSIPSQLRDLQGLVEKEKLSCIETITETRSAASPYNRPAYTDMIARIKKGDASGIIVWHIDRLARNELEFGELKYLLQVGVIKSIWTASREYRSADNGLLISLEASMATQYSRDLGDKVRNGLTQKCILGQPPGVAKLGYLNTKFQEHGSNKIIVDPERWHIIRKAFDLLLSRQYNTPQIVDVLNNEYGFRTRTSTRKMGRPLHRSVLYRIFTDPFYSGFFYYRGSLHRGSYKEMISLEEFDRVQEILGRKGKPRPHKHHFAFTGLMKCGVCGCAITASKKTKLVKATNTWASYTFYHCTKRKGKELCTDKHYTTLADLEAMIRTELIAYQLMGEFKQWGIEVLNEMYSHEADKQQVLIDETIGQEQKLLKEIDVLLDLRISNTISEEKYLEKKTEKEALLLRVQENTSKLRTGGQNWLRDLTEKLDIAANIVKKFDTGILELQKDVCNNFGWNWTLKAKKLFIDKFEWFEAIKEYSDSAIAVFGRLEPQKAFDLYGQKASFDMLRPMLRRLRNHIRTKPP